MTEVEPEPKERPPLSSSQVRSRAVDGVLSIVFRGVSIRALGFLGNLVLARLLTPKDFGVVAFGFTMIALAQFVGDGGIGAALIRRNEPPSQNELRAMLGFTLVLTTVVAVVIAAIGLPFGRTGEIAALMVCSLPLEGIRLPAMIMAERDLAYGPIVRSDITEILVYNVVAIGLVAAGAGVWGLAIAVVLRALTGSVVIMTIGPVDWMWPKLSWGAVRPYLRFGVAFQAVNVVNTARDQGLNLLALALGSLSILGIWTLANRILQGIMLVFASLWRVSFPAISRLLEAGDPVQPVIERALRITTVVTGFIVVAIGGSAPALVPVAFGARWNDVISVLPWAAAGILVAGPISTSATGLLYGRGLVRIPLIAVLAHTTAWFAVALIFLPRAGAEALGAGWCLGAIVDVAILSRALGREGVLVWRNCAPALLVALGSGAAGWVLATTVVPQGVALALSLAAAELLYLAGLLLFWRTPVVETIGVLRRAAARKLPSRKAAVA